MYSQTSPRRSLENPEEEEMESQEDPGIIHGDQIGDLMNRPTARIMKGKARKIGISTTRKRTTTAKVLTHVLPVLIFDDGVIAA